MKKLIYLFLILSTNQLYSQADTTKIGPFEVFHNGQWIISESAEPPKVFIANGLIDDVLVSNLEYPYQARRMGIEGNTVIEIQISPEGSITSYIVVQHIGADTDKELKKIGQLLPKKWVSAKYEGQEVASKVLILIKFSLYGENSLAIKDSFYKAYVAKPISPSKTEVKNANDLGVKKKKKKKKKN